MKTELEANAERQRILSPGTVIGNIFLRAVTMLAKMRVTIGATPVVIAVAGIVV